MLEITLPKAGRAMKDGTVVRWLKSEGQTVEAGEVLLEVETDRATVEVESPHSGTLRKILVAERTTVPVHTPIAILGDPGEDVSAAAAAAAEGAREAAETNPAHDAQAVEPAPAAPPAGAVVPILMPQVGNTMEEGTILKWLVAPGETIREGDVLFEVETDKANIEIEAVDSGRLARIVVPEGETVPIKTPVAYLADNDADVDAYVAAQGPAVAEAPAATAPAAQTPAAATVAAAPLAAAPTSASGRIKASPAARKLAAQRGIDLGSLPPGSGPGGRILSGDVPEAAAAAVVRPAALPPAKRQVVRHPMSSMRRAIGRNLLTSKQTIPHFYLKLTIDAGPLQDFYQIQKAKYPCSINDLVVMACAKAVQEFAGLRSQLDGEELVEFPTANIGIAVGVPDGLVVPVVVDAARMTLAELAAETKRLVGAAREGKLEGIGQGVFTITNLGMLGIEEFAAIINPPEAAILAVGTIREEVIVRDQTMLPGRRMTMVLSCDHRIVDGLMAAEFVARLKELLEWPGQLV